MSKQRPSKAAGQGRAGPRTSLADWFRRLYRNSYTRGGRRIVLEGWSVKIQHRRRRHTFSLQAKSRRKAAAEARVIYETLRTEGWESVMGGGSGRMQRVEGPALTDARYWRERLLKRLYRFPASGEGEQDLAVWVEHAGQGYYFPLGVSDPDSAAVRALRIYRTAVERGWDALSLSFPRELIVGFEWYSNPVMWTYTTIHTLVARRPGSDAAEARSFPHLARVLVAEEDVGIRRALCWCIDQLAGAYAVPCDSAASFTREFESRRPHMVLLNHNLTGRLGVNLNGQVTMLPPSVPALGYSTCVDGDQLFVSTPGGAQGYLLKRVKPTRLLEPIFDDAGRPNFSASGLQDRVKMYFKALLQPRSDPEASQLARLTRREREVLDLLSKGCVDKEIAQALGISAWTVHDHIKNIFERLGVRTRTEAVVRYLEK